MKNDAPLYPINTEIMDESDVQNRLYRLLEAYSLLVSSSKSYYGNSQSDCYPFSSFNCE